MAWWPVPWLARVRQFSPQELPEVRGGLQRGIQEFRSPLALKFKRPRISAWHVNQCHWCYQQPTISRNYAHSFKRRQGAVRAPILLFPWGREPWSFWLKLARTGACREYDHDPWARFQWQTCFFGNYIEHIRWRSPGGLKLLRSGVWLIFRERNKKARAG